MENNEDILKEFEDIKIEHISNDSFDIELIKGQFGENQLLIRPNRLYVIGGAIGSGLFLIFGLSFLFFSSPAPLPFQFFLVYFIFSIVVIFLVNRHSHVVITKGKIIIKKVLFKQLISAQSIHTKNINYLKTVSKTAKNGIVYNLYINFYNGKEMLLFKSGDKYDVRDLELVIKKFIGIR